VSAVGVQAQYDACPPPPSGTTTIELSTIPTRPPPQDNAVAPAPGIAPTHRTATRRSKSICAHRAFGAATRPAKREKPVRNSSLRGLG